MDCFYVYLTVSDQQTLLATKAKDPEIRSIALYQAARYSQHCRVFAPVYRQVTLAGLLGGDQGGEIDRDILQRRLRGLAHLPAQVQQGPRGGAREPFAGDLRAAPAGG